MYLCGLVSSMFRKKRFLTCVFPPEFSWTRLREREAEQQKDENSAPITLHSPLATSSWKKGYIEKLWCGEREERENIFLVKDLHFPSCSLVLSTPNFNLILQCCLWKVHLVCINFFLVFLCQYFGHGIGCSEGNKAHSDGVTNYVTNEAKVGERGRGNSEKWTQT